MKGGRDKMGSYTNLENLSLRGLKTFRLSFTLIVNALLMLSVLAFSISSSLEGWYYSLCIGAGSVTLKMSFDMFRSLVNIILEIQSRNN